MALLTPEAKQRRMETIARNRRVVWESVRDARELSAVMWFFRDTEEDDQ